MAPIGFSTGTLSKGSFREGINMLSGKPAAAIELSALREEELAPLMSSLDVLDLRQFSYISLHAPSRLTSLTESALVDALIPAAERGWPIVVHPDVITVPSLWEPLGSWLCIENMDKRKPCGRTARELQTIFKLLPEASLCFDLAHARQIDPTMCEAARILHMFGARIRQIHLSEINSRSRHEPISSAAVAAYRSIAKLLPHDVPIIIESPASTDGQVLDSLNHAWSCLFHESGHAVA